MFKYRKIEQYVLHRYCGRNFYRNIMKIVILGIIICIIIFIYFMVHYIEASVFVKPGFINDEIPLGKIKLEQHYHFEYSGIEKDEER